MYTVRCLCVGYRRRRRRHEGHKGYKRRNAISLCSRNNSRLETHRAGAGVFVNRYFIIATPTPSRTTGHHNDIRTCVKQ